MALIFHLEIVPHLLNWPSMPKTLWSILFLIKPDRRSLQTCITKLLHSIYIYARADDPDLSLPSALTEESIVL